MLTDFQKFFTVVFAAKFMSHISPHFKGVLHYIANTWDRNWRNSVARSTICFMFTKLTNMIGKIKYASYGVKLNVHNCLLSREDSHRSRRLRHLSRASDIDQVLFQFIDVMNLVDQLLHFSPSFVVKRIQNSAVGCQRCGEMKAGLVSVVPGGWLSLTLDEQQQEHCIVGR